MLIIGKRSWHFTKTNAAVKYQPTWMLAVAALLQVIDGMTGLIMFPFRRYGTLFYSDWCVTMLRYGVAVRKAERQGANENTMA